MPKTTARKPRTVNPSGQRFGAHVTGGVTGAPARAQELGCQAMQVFTASPRQWKASPIAPERAAEFRRACAEMQISPVVVHANYLINLAGANDSFHAGSVVAFRGELERAAAIGANYLVLHPGSGEAGKCVDSIAEASQGFAWGGLQLLLENTAGAGKCLGGSFAELAAMLKRLRRLPVGVCIDTCHAWVAGYDLATPSGFSAMMDELDGTIGLQRVPVFHCNDAKAGRGSHLDRHQHIGAGKLGAASFRRLLRDPRLGNATFILETPIDSPTAQAEDLATLRALAPRARGRRDKAGVSR